MAAPHDQRLTIIAIQRFGLGVRPGDLERIGSNLREMLLEEVAQKAVSQVPTHVGSAPYTTTAETAAAIHIFQEKERMEREAKPKGDASVNAKPANSMAGNGTMGNDMSGGISGGMSGGISGAGSAVGPVASPQAQPVAGGLRSTMQASPSAMLEPPAAPKREEPKREDPGNPAFIYREEMKARFHTALDPLVGFSERLVHFWSNHFCVSAAKGGLVRGLAGAYEREVVRPHVYGRFGDMLLASATHPAMLLYLDNQQSLGPNSRAGQRRGRGLNENLGREILELHTLGVAGGYTQADVTSLARIITGWSVVNREGKQGTSGTFFYNDNLHEPGRHDLLGKSYGQSGFEQGKAALNDLAAHPATAQHVARKLSRHFVADDPPPSLVARLAKVFTDSNGDLQQLSRSLLESPEAWAPQQAKIRSPQEFLLAASRAFARKPETNQIIGPLSAMGQRLWEPPGPNGYADTVATWASAEGMKTRLDVSAAIARQVAPGAIDPRKVADMLLGPLASHETRQAIARAESKPQALALMLMSPEFQRR